MYKQIFDNDFVTVKFAKNKNIAVIKWKEKCGNIIDQKQKSFFDDIRDLIKKIAPEKILADMSACNYLLTVDSGTWFKNPIFDMYADLPSSRIALIIPQNLFVNAFFDAARAYEKTDPNKRMQYFKETEKARNWLKS
jgi:hypothetical protein